MKQTILKILTSKYFIIPIAALCLYSLIGFYIIPQAILWYAPKFAKEQLRCEASLGKVRLNPFLFKIDIKDVRINTLTGEPVAGFKRFFCDLDIISVASKPLTLTKLILEKPVINVIIDPDGNLNLANIGTKTRSGHPAGESKPFLILLKNISISGGKISFTDKRQSLPADLNIHNIDLNLSDISTVQNQTGNFFLSASTTDNESVRCQGKISLIPFLSRGKLAFENIQLESLWKFFRDSLSLESFSGKMSMTTDYTIDSSSADMQARLNDFLLEISELALKLQESDRNLLEIKKIKLDQAGLNLAEKQVQIGNFLIANGSVNSLIDEEGQINFGKIVKNTKNQNTISVQSTQPSSIPNETKTTGSSWTVNADNVEIKDIAVILEDFSRIEPVFLGVSHIDVRFRSKIKAGSDKTSANISGLSTELKDVRIGLLKTPDKPLFHTETLSVEGCELDLEENSLDISRIALKKGAIDFSLDKNKEINLVSLFDLKKKDPVSLLSTQSAEKKPASWEYNIKTFEIDGFHFDVSDLAVMQNNPVLSVEAFSCRLSDIDGKSTMNIESGFNLSSGGAAKIKGKLNPETPSVEANVDIQNISLKPLQPYIEPFVTLILQSADVSIKGVFSYKIPASGADVAFKGGINLDKLQLAEPDVKKLFMGWESLQIPDIKFSLKPDKLDIAEIRLIKPVGELIIAEDQTINLTRVIKKQEEQTKTTPSPALPSKKDESIFPVHVGRLKIEKGDIVFGDFSLQPQFKTNIKEIKGFVSGFSSVSDLPAQIQLDGRVDQYGMTKIGGNINLFDPTKATDITLVFRNVEMTSLTPYSGKFAGRRIKSGKLSMDLKYQIENRKLVGDNKIILDNLILGEHVDNPGASSLPLDLAIALLRDSNGIIDIGLPVTGDLGDPQFSYGQLIGKALFNFLTKIITSPFRALGSLFGLGSENMDTISFDPARHELLPPEQEKIHKIAEMLNERPLLLLNIQGQYSLETDVAGIKAINVRKLIAESAGEKNKPGEDSGPVDLSASNIQSAVEKLFKERTGLKSYDEIKKPIEESSKPRPEKALILTKELYSRLVETEPVSKEALIELALRRAKEIIKELEETGGISSERLVLKNHEELGSGQAGAKFTLGS